MNSLEYKDRSIVVFGGSSGIGRQAVGEFATLGATVHLATRTEESYVKALNQLRRRRVNVDSLAIYPFIANVMDKKQLVTAAVKAKSQGPEITDIIDSHAAGIDNFQEQLFERYLDPISEYTFNTPIEDLDPEKRAIVEGKLAAMRADLAVWTEEALPYATQVNYEGTFNIFEVSSEVFPENPKKVVYNSTWGYLSGTPGIEIPLLYRPIDRSKALIRDRIKREGLPVAMLVASLVTDTQIGMMFKDFLLNLMNQNQREAVMSSSVQTKDVVSATKVLLGQDNWPSTPQTLFVYRNNREVVLAPSLSLSAMYTHPYRF